MNILLKATNLGYHSRGYEWLFKNINLRVNSEEIIIIQGGTGTGKSLLTDILCGLKKPSQGNVGKNASLAVATQEFTLYKDLTVQENLEFISAINQNTPINRPDIISLTGMNGWEKTKAAKLPAGLKKMLQIACAVIRRTPLLIFDEPTVGMDQNLNAKFWLLVKQLVQDGRGILILTNQTAPADIPAQVFNLTDNGLVPINQADTNPDNNLGLEYKSQGVN